MLTEITVSYQVLLEVLGSPNSWFRGDDANEKREQYIMENMQKEYPGNYTLEEYYNPATMSFRYRLKFNTEADEMWFKLKYQ